MKYEIIKNLGVISTNKNGWSREVNIVAWGDNPPKLDIREWSPDHVKMSRGMTLPLNEVEILCMILHNYMRGKDVAK